MCLPLAVDRFPTSRRQHPRASFCRLTGTLRHVNHARKPHTMRHEELKWHSSNNWQRLVDVDEGPVSNADHDTFATVSRFDRPERPTPGHVSVRLNCGSHGQEVAKRSSVNSVSHSASFLELHRVLSIAYSEQLVNLQKEGSFAAVTFQCSNHVARSTSMITPHLPQSPRTGDESAVLLSDNQFQRVRTAACQTAGPGIATNQCDR